MCVLLVEDESLIREIMAESLQDAGFEVCEAASGEAAMALIGSAAMHFRVLVTDFHMPGGRNGALVAEYIRKRLPGIAVIIATGRPEVFQQSWRDELGYNVLCKPYTAADLINLMTRLLPA